MTAGASEPADAGTGGHADIAELLLPPEIPPESARLPPAGRLAELRGETMGTEWSLCAVVPDDVDEASPGEALERSFALVIAQMSQWEPASELSRFNRAPAGSAFPVSRQFAHVLDCALKIAQVSDGAFDPTLGHASELWGFGAGAAPEQVPDAAIARETRRYRWSDVAFDAAQGQVLQPGGLALDFSGIAKGFAVDLGIHELERIGITHALLEIGGELRGAGLRQDGLPWLVDIDVPPGSDAPPTRVGLAGWAVATSGNYRRRREAEGRSWSHGLDPATGLPIDDSMLSVTVLHRGCMQADALASAVMVMGIERGLAFADAHAIPARIVARPGVYRSAAWRRWLD